MLTEREEIGVITVVADGTILVRRETVIERDGVEVARTFHRTTHAPAASGVGDDKPERVKAIAGAVWTPALVADHERKRAAADTKRVPK